MNIYFQVNNRTITILSDYFRVYFIFSGDEYVPSGNTTVVGGDINPAGGGGYYPYGQPTFLVEEQNESSSLNVLN